MKRRSSSSSLGLGAAAVLLLSSSAPAVHAGDKEFGQVVHHIESYYHARRSNRLLFGFVGVVVQFWHPYGVKSLKMALFEDHNFSGSVHDDEFSGIVQGALSQQWRPLVRVWSRRNSERTYIYAADAGPKSKDIKLLIVTLDQSDAVVLKLKVDPDRLAQMMDEPDSMGGLVHQGKRPAEVREAWR